MAIFDRTHLVFYVKIGLCLHIWLTDVEHFQMSLILNVFKIILELFII
jgi:hypothetical protein